MAMQMGGGGGVKSDINVTPLVDVMLVLLIIMMIIAPLLQKGVDVRLPDRGQQREQARDAGPDGRSASRPTRRSGSTASRSARRNCAAASRRSSRPRRKSSILIKADEDAPYSAIMDAMDKLRASGIEDVGLITDSKSAERACRREASNGIPRAQALRRRRGLQGLGPAAERGHEHHADDRRAARAARHLHGRPAAVAEGARHQPAAGNEPAAEHDADQPDRAGVHARTRRSRSTTRTSASTSSKNSSAPSSRIARTRRCSSAATARCATATSST